MDKRFMAILVVVVLALGGLYFSSHKKTESNGSNNAAQGSVSNHTMGAGKKSVTLIEYGDYECPACGAYYPLVKQVVAEYGDDITFQFRNFPLDSIHLNARAGARAAEAASLQNKFWEMHDMLYEQQQSWTKSSNPTEVFQGYAKQLGLDVAKFKTDYQSDKVNGTINADISAGQKIKAVSTPTFQLNGKVIDSETQQTMGSVAGFKKVIEAEIAKKNPGTPAAAPTPAVTEPAPVITPSTEPNQ